MTHKPIQINDLCLAFSHKICFEEFNTQIIYGSRIAIIGRNGSGKSSLLKMLHGELQASSGKIIQPSDALYGYVPQIIEHATELSGGQRLNAALTQALTLDPNILLLDEPTNHLDQRNRKNLIRMLRSFSGTLILVSHDVELLSHCIDTLWHIDNGNIHEFTGNYADYMAEIQRHRIAIEHELSILDKQRNDMHHALMKEQQRAAKSKSKGAKSIEQRKWPTVVSNAKASRSAATTGRKKAAISHKKQELAEQLTNLRLPEIIKPNFTMTTNEINDRILVSIRDGNIGYDENNLLLKDINLSLRNNDRIALHGDNASGKSTFIKAILNDPMISKSGAWNLPKSSAIGYLDQHYNTLALDKSVYENIAEQVPNWSQLEIRRHLCDFLFRKNEEVMSKVASLSGGEKARLSLAQIAALTPPLLILDEITNNLDLETREHVIQVLKNYPGALLIVSHDIDFLSRIGITEHYKILAGELTKVTHFLSAKQSR